MKITAYHNYDRHPVIMDLMQFECRWLSSRFYNAVSPYRIGAYLKLGLIDIKYRHDGRAISYRLTPNGDDFICRHSYRYQRRYKIEHMPTQLTLFDWG